MSTKSYGCHGHVVKAETLLPLLPKSIHEQYNSCLEQNDWEGIHNLLEKHLPTCYPTPECVFCLNDECECDDEMELNVVYVMWMEESLYVRKETDEMKALKQDGILPTLHNWVTYG